MDKQNVRYIYNGILFSHKKEEIPVLATTWLNPEDIMLSDISQKQKVKYCKISLIFGIKKSQAHKSRSCEGWEEQGMEICWPKCTNFQL